MTLFGAIAALFKKPASLEKRLRQALSCPVELEFTQNSQRRIFISPGAQRDAIKVQLDILFKDIEGETFQHLVDFIEKGDSDSKDQLIAYLRHARNINPLPKAEHPLQGLLDQLVQKHFPSLPKITLVWGRRGKKGQQKSIRLASFWPAKMEVRLHPYAIDHRVPRFYQTFLIFHELCHAWLMFSGKAKPGEHHGPDFYQLEDQCPEVEKARSWEKDVLPQVLGEIQREEELS